MKLPYECSSADHRLSRRQMLGGMAGAAVGTLGLGALLHPAAATQMAAGEKQVLLIWLDGAMSQFESWDPKPHTEFGGPFRAIPTSVPGLHVSELLPHTSQQMHHLSVIRNLHTRFEDHSRAVAPIQRGDPKDRGVAYPYLGSAVAKMFGPGNSELPPYIHIKPGSGGFHYKDAGFLGAQYGALALGDGKLPDNLVPPAELTPDSNEARQSFRNLTNRHFSAGRRTAKSEAYEYSYQMAEQIMKRRDLFDQSTFDAQDVECYGSHGFGRHLLLARRLLEAGTRFVKVTMYHWDTHADNFNYHQELVGAIDQPFAALMHDLSERSMLDNVLVLMLSEFGRTPKINQKVGRDHYPEAWSMVLGGAGIQKGAVVGKTNARGTMVEGDEIDIGHVFHTAFAALGVDAKKEEYMNGTQPLPIAHDECGPIKELLV